jgi:Papain-like cysteine protease AvrRpt2
MSLWTVQNFSQSTASLCWEACARMLWHWHFKNLNGYSQKAGNYLTLKTGLTQQQMDVFYRNLGLRALTGARGANLRFALGWSPVIFTDINKASGHAMVASGFNQGVYTVVNPCAVMSVDFDKGTDSCTVGTLARTATQVEKPLGSYIWYW